MGLCMIRSLGDAGFVAQVAPFGFNQERHFVRSLSSPTRAPANSKRDPHGVCTASASTASTGSSASSAPTASLPTFPGGAGALRARGQRSS